LAEVTTDELKRAIESEHGGTATFCSSVSKSLKHCGEPVWEGTVHVFALEIQSKYSSTFKTVYAWCDALPDGKHRLSIVPATSQIAKPEDAVMAGIEAQRRVEDEAGRAERRLAQASADAKVAKAWAKAPKSATSLDGPMRPVNSQAGGWKRRQAD
jgi:hypothetical protein